MQPAVAAEARVFHTLDALRGVAAIGVVIFHMGPAFAPLAVPGGYLAVDLFFIMSGVVLSHAYERRFRRGMGTMEFMRLRLIRLYPLYLVGLLLGIAVTVASMFGRNSMGWELSTLVPAILLALLFLPDLSGRPVDTLFPLNVPCWSLFLELVVNLLFVMLWPFATRGRLIAVAVAMGIVVAGGTVYYGNVDQGSTAASLAIGLARTLFGFSVGVLIARQVDPAHRRTSNLAFVAIITTVVVAIAGSPVGASRVVWDIAAVLLLFPAVVLWGTRFEPGAGLLKIAGTLGVVSYAVYVIHSPLSAVLRSATRDIGSDLPGFAAPPVLGIGALGALLVGAWLLDRLYDAPVRRFLLRVFAPTSASRSQKA